MRFFIMNKTDDYAGGTGSTGVSREDHLCFGDGETNQGWYLSEPFDSGRDGTVWHRWSACMREAKHSAWTLRVYSCDQAEYGAVTGITRALGEGRIEYSGIKRRLERYLRMEKRNQGDVLLRGVRGRYLYFLLEVYNQETVPLYVSQIRIDFPREAWTEYLPAAFGEADGFLERYLSIFQTLYQDLEERAEHREELLDVESADPDMLFQMAQWLGIPCISLWTEKKLRYLMKNAGRLYQIRGTRKGLGEILGLYADSPPMIVEQREACRFASQSGLCSRLYGLHGCCLTVLFPRDRVKNGEAVQAVKRIAESLIPSGLECRVILLYPRIQLDGYTYLGLNSVLSLLPGLALDGTSQVAYSALT